MSRTFQNDKFNSDVKSVKSNTKTVYTTKSQFKKSKLLQGPMLAPVGMKVPQDGPNLSNKKAQKMLTEVIATEKLIESLLAMIPDELSGDWPQDSESNP